MCKDEGEKASLPPSTPPPPHPQIPYLFQASLGRGQNREESLFERGEGYTETSRRLYHYPKMTRTGEARRAKKERALEREGEGGGRERERERERSLFSRPTVGFLIECAKPL